MWTYFYNTETLFTINNTAASFRMLLKHLYPNYYCCFPVLNGFYGLVSSAGQTCPRMTMFGPSTPSSMEPLSRLHQIWCNLLAIVMKYWYVLSHCHVRCNQKSTGISVPDPTSMWVARFSIFGCPVTPRMCSHVWVPHVYAGWPSYIWHPVPLAWLKDRVSIMRDESGFVIVGFYSTRRCKIMKRKGSEVKTGAQTAMRIGSSTNIRCFFWTVDSGRHLDVNYSSVPYNSVSRQNEGAACLVINALLRSSAHLHVNVFTYSLFSLSCYPLNKVKVFSLENTPFLFAVSSKISRLVFWHTGSESAESQHFLLFLVTHPLELLHMFNSGSCSAMLCLANCLRANFALCRWQPHSALTHMTGCCCEF